MSHVDLVHRFHLEMSHNALENRTHILSLHSFTLSTREYGNLYLTDIMKVCFFKQAMKSASECLHTTHLCQTSVRMKTTDYTARTATCCSSVCSVAVVCLIMLLLLRCEVGGIIQTLRNSYTN